MEVEFLAWMSVVFRKVALSVGHSLYKSVQVAVGFIDLFNELPTLSFSEHSAFPHEWSKSEFCANRDVVTILQQALSLLQDTSQQPNAVRPAQVVTPATGNQQSFDRTRSADRSAGTTSASNSAQLPAPSTSGPSTLREMRAVELRRSFAPYGSVRSEGLNRSSIAHSQRRPYRESSKRFFLLGSPTEMTTPPNARKALLQAEDLGEQILVIKNTMSSESVKQLIRQSYSKLGNREFQLLRATGSGSVKLICPIKTSVSVPDGQTIIAGRVGIVYIRPTTAIIEEDVNDDDNASEDSQSDIIQIEGEVNSNRTNPAESLDEHQFTDVCDTASDFSDSNGAMDIESVNNEVNQIAASDSSTSDFCTIEDFTNDIHMKNPGIQPIFIARDDFLDSLIGLYMKDPTLDILKTTSVIFAGEAGRDVGGLTKEFFDRGHDALLGSKYMGKYVLFDGQDDHKCPSHDNLLLKTGVFQAIGKFFAHSFFCTGKALHGLSRSIVEYLLNEDDEIKDDITVKIEDVPSYETQTILIQLQNWTSDTALDSRTLSRIQTEAIFCGFTDSVTFTNREILKETILLHHILHVRKAQLDAIKKPLRTFGILKFLSPKPYFYDNVFPTSTQRTYNSEQLLNHIDFTGEAKDRVRTLYTTYINAMDSLTITEFLKCVTSWPYIDGNRITVDVGDHHIFHVSTCLNKISIPEWMEDEQILDYMRYAILVGGFGSV